MGFKTLISAMKYFANTFLWKAYVSNQGELHPVMWLHTHIHTVVRMEGNF